MTSVNPNSQQIQQQRQFLERAAKDPAFAQQVAKQQLSNLQAQTANKTSQVAQPLLDSMEVTLNRVDRNPVATKKQTSFEATFGSETKKLSYSLTQNLVVGEVNSVAVDKLAGQTKLLLEATYRFYKNRYDESNISLKEPIKQSALSIFRHLPPPICTQDSDGLKEIQVMRSMKNYHISFNEFDGTITLQVIGKDGESFHHKIMGNIEGDSQTSSFEITDYINDMKEQVEKTLKKDAKFAEKTGYNFFERYVQSGGLIQKSQLNPTRSDLDYRTYDNRVRNQPINPQSQS